MKYLLTSNHCPHCKQAKKKLEKELQSGELEELPIDSEKGFTLVAELNIQAVPTIVECDEKKCRIIE